MKTSFLTLKRNTGSTLLTTLVIAAVVGLTAVAYLKMVSNQNYLVQRSQAWNTTIPIIEAGVEEALTHLNRNGTNALNLNLTADGWTLQNGLYVKQSWVGESYYVVTLKFDTRPEIVSQGYVPQQANYVSAGGPMFATLNLDPLATARYVYRTVKVVATPDGMFVKGMVARFKIDLAGNDIHTDSFDSTNPSYSTGGQYDPAKARDNGDIATNDGVTNTLGVGNANIWGRVATGPKGSVTMGPNGGVGDKNWLSDPSHAGTIQPGYRSDDMNVSFPPVKEPWTGGAFNPTPGVYNGDFYNFKLDGGNFELSSLKIAGQKDMIVTAPSVLWVKDDIDITGMGQITIAPGGSLTLYVGASSGDDSVASLGGLGIVNQPGNATNFVYYGLPSNKQLSYGGNATFIGAVYAPSANFTLGGGGTDTYDFMGASVTKSVKMNGHFNFHYDENLGRMGPLRGYIATSWDEIKMDPIPPPSASL